MADGYEWLDFGRVECGVGGPLARGGEGVAWNRNDGLGSDRIAQEKRLFPHRKAKFILCGNARIGVLIESSLIQHLQNRIGQIGGIGESAPLIVGESNLFLGLERLEQIRDEILPAAPKNPRSADDAG